MNLFTTIMVCSVFHTNSITNAMIITGSNANPLAITPIVNGQAGPTRVDFKSPEQAAAFADQQLKSGNQVDIGMMQIPSVWLDKINKRGTTLIDLLRPCKNLAVGTDLLNEAEAYCATKTDSADERDNCALSFYKTSTANDGLKYATDIQAYAKNHPIKSNPINLKIDFDGWQLDPKQHLPLPLFGQTATANTTDTADVDDADATPTDSATT